MKPIVFFLITLATLMYFVTFWQNRKKKVKFHFLKQDIEISLGLLAFGLFLDGAIITAIMVWLLY